MSVLTSQIKATEILIDDWHARIKTNRSLLPSPTIAQAQMANRGSVLAHCTACAHRGEVPFQKIHRPSSTLIADLLPALICTNCGRKGPPAVQIRGVAFQPIEVRIPPDQWDREEPVAEIILRLNPEELDQEETAEELTVDLNSKELNSDELDQEP